MKRGDFEQQVKRAIVDNAKVCGFVTVGRKNLKSERWSDVGKYIFERKEAAEKDMLETKDEIRKEECNEIYKEKNRRVKICILKSIKEEK